MICALAGAAPADAGWKIDRSLAIARAVFPTSPCVQEARIQFARWPGPALPAHGAATMSALGWVVPGHCVIFINVDDPPSGWGEFCGVVLHDGGHLAGLGHSRSPDSIMNEVIPWYGDARCRERGRPFLEARGLLHR